MGRNVVKYGGSVAQVEPAQAEVLVHYREIAAESNRRANMTCKRVYSHLVDRFLRGRSRLLKLGSGASEQLSSLGIPLAMTCDLCRRINSVSRNAAARHPSG
jgi:hypothetical protein